MHYRLKIPTRVRIYHFISRAKSAGTYGTTKYTEKEKLGKEENVGLIAEVFLLAVLTSFDEALLVRLRRVRKGCGR